MKQVKFVMPLRIVALLFAMLLSVGGSFAQDITVNGIVKDTSGETVIGASVSIAGKPVAVTDIDGKFTLKSQRGQQLTISCMGYIAKTVPVQPMVNVILEEDNQELEQVVVIGYGQVRKNDLTGSVVAIRPDEKNHGMITSAQDMLQGKVAGVNVNSYSGAPGEGAQIRIRGGASLNASNNPLIVIDGMPMDNNDTKGLSNPLSLINPQDIESFTILKDASATAIYGSRGSNGVIIITTKVGKKGQPAQVSYNGSVSVSTVSKKLDVLNASEYRQAIASLYGEDSEAYLGLGDADTDWQDEIYRPALSHDHGITVSGGVGGEKWSMPYRASLGYTSQDGVLINSDYKRVTAGINIAPSLFDNHLNINANAKYAYSHTKPGGTDAVGAATSMDPTRPVKSDDETYTNWGGYYQWVTSTSAYDDTYPYALNEDAPSNPVELAKNYNIYKCNDVFLGSIDADYKIHGFEDLRIHANLAAEYTWGGEYQNYDPKSTYGYYYGGLGENTEKKYNITFSAYLQYYKDFNKNHHFDIMAGYEYQHMKYWGDQWYYTYYPSTSTKTDDDGNALAGTLNSSSETNWAGQTYLVSWFGRANYTLMNRYLFTATVRYDGSSRFADGERWGLFPSAAVAWRVKDENFLKDVDAVSDLKIRLGWGQTGQQDTGKEYYTATYKVSTSNNHLYPVGPNNDGTLYQPLVYNDDLTWETTTTYNVGLDLGFFNQRLTLNADAYYRKTTDLLCTPTIAAGMNFDNAMMLNAGELTNKGVEVAISGKPVVTKDWFVDLGINFAYNKNEVTELYGGRDAIEAGMQVGTNENITYHVVGKPASSFWVYQQVYDENGRPVMGSYVDRNADGTIDENDRYYYKSINAPWTGGFYLKVGFKQWDLGTNLRASFGNYVYNNLESGKVNSSVLYNSKGYYENTTADILALGWSSYNYSLSDYFVQNASFLKMDNITIGFNFQDWLKSPSRRGISGRIYASVSNVFTLTKYDGLDPEQTTGKESSLYPRCRTYQLGINLNF